MPKSLDLIAAKSCAIFLFCWCEERPPSSGSPGQCCTCLCDTELFLAGGGGAWIGTDLPGIFGGGDEEMRGWRHMGVVGEQERAREEICGRK